MKLNPCKTNLFENKSETMVVAHMKKSCEIDTGVANMLLFPEKAEHL